MISTLKSLNQFDRVVPILNVRDYQASMKYYIQTLGFRKNWEWGEPPGFGCISRGKVEVFLNQVNEGNFATTINIFVADVDDLYEEAKKKGATIRMTPQTKEWGKELRVEDPDGNVIHFTQMLPNKEIVTERTDMKVRVEKRLASLMDELSRESGRNVGQVLEEIILHSFEPIPGQEGEASASPHTIETLQRIEKLKKKYNLDYETHDAYGFAEKSNEVNAWSRRFADH